MFLRSNLTVWAVLVALLAYVNTHAVEKRSVTVCMDELGCFSKDLDFIHPIYRPVSLLPADRQKINTRFLLYTRTNNKQEDLIRQKNKKDLDNSHFDPKKETKIITHGYFDNQYLGEWMRTMMKEFLMHGDYNVFIVDWSGGNGLPYTQATANTRVVGAEIACFVSFLEEEYGLDPKMLHILGHSLGAHVAGYVGKRIKNLGRITGMDPAQPLFQYMPESVRLDPSDALFVDVIHTDSKSMLTLGFGMSQLVGHVDFFPNNGNAHPGCSWEGDAATIITDGIGEGVRRFASCNHQRAVDFMTDSINEKKCDEIAFACADWETYLDGGCVSCGENGEKCAIMGMRAIEYAPLVKGNNSVKFYTQTADKAPYCTFQYRILVNLQKDVGKGISGNMKLIIRGSKKIETFDLEHGKNVDLSPGSMLTSLVATSKELGQIEDVVFSWKKAASITGLFSKNYIYVKEITVEPINKRDSKLRDEMVRRFCGGKDNGQVVSGDSITLLPTAKC